MKDFIVYNSKAKIRWFKCSGELGLVICLQTFANEYDNESEAGIEVEED
jgi:hypothetical protein